MRNIFQMEDSIVKKFFSNDNILKIVAFVSALLMFFAINGDGNSFSEYFSTSTTIENVPIEVVYDEQYVVTGLPETINVIVSGPDANVQAAQRKADTLKATLDINVTEEGTKEIDASSITFTSIGDVNISPIVKTYEVEVQTKISKDIPVKVNYVNSDELSEGVMLDDPTLSTDMITVTGGSQDVSKIEEIKAIVDLTSINSAEGNSVDVTAPLNAYDDQGTSVENVTLSQDTVDVTQKFTKNTIELPINYTFTNLPTDQYVKLVCDQEDTTLCESTDDETIYKANTELFGDREQIDQMTSGVEYRINFSTMNTNNNQVVATAVLPEGVYTSTPTQTVTVTLEEGVSKTLKGVPVVFTNLDSGLTAKVTDSKDAFIDVKITGAKSTIDSIDGSNIKAELNLSGYKAGDNPVIPVQISVADYVTVEPAKETIQVQIVDE